MPHTKSWATAAAALVSIALPGLSVAATLNVPGDFATIQACINAAVSGVDVCVAAPGTYHETINFLGKAITLRSSGGADVTRIDATGIGGSVVTCKSGEGPETVLNGFTITGGTGTYVPDFDAYVGGGMFNYFSSPTVTNCTFTGNTADAGGGMYNEYSDPTLDNCNFSENEAVHGGAVFSYYSSLTVLNVAFIGNSASESGGGMYNYYSTPTILNTCFTGNTATNGGGVRNEISEPTLKNCTFGGNYASFRGGAMYNYLSSPAITSCTFIGNATGSYGGGMFNADSSPTVSTSLFSKNSAHSGGGMLNSDSSPTVTNCAFRGNSAYWYGGAICNAFGSLIVTTCVFSGNTTRNMGGGMYIYGGSPTVTNCTFSENTAAIGGGMHNYASSPMVAECVLWSNSPDELHNDTSSPTIHYSDVQGGLPVGAIDGGGNIAVDPMFVRPPDPGPDGTWDGVDDDYGDLRLQAGSPCINAGDPGFVAQPGETDLEGHARVLCEYVDMGAYEFGIGDYDCDQSVDLADFANWSACMTGPSDSGAFHSTIDIRQSTIGCAAFDFNGDGNVDLLDFAAFQLVLTAP